MVSYETKLRVRYSETDKMGYVYYGNYPQYYEVGRVELMRSLGFSYRHLEEMGIMMPVLSLNIRYLRPAYYDDELTIKTMVREMPASRVRFEYEIYNMEGQMVNIGEAVLGFIHAETRRPMRPPKEIMDTFQQYFK
jgi:acyl-CoA thioester hydrolase